jgi:hypothetical protein
MFERTVSYDAFFLPGPNDLDTDEALTLGLRWLLAQSGEPLIVLSRKANISNNPVLQQTVNRYKIKYTAPPRVWDASWSGGAILVPWAGERALLDVDEYLARQASAVCVIGWSDGAHDAWIAGHAARDLRNPTEPLATPQLDPVVLVAMTQAGHAINHNNALVTDDEKAMVVLTLKELVRGGYTYDVDQLVAWATSQGWYPAEIPRLRDYATKVLEGRSFRLRGGWGPGKGAVKEWEAEAANLEH